MKPRDYIIGQMNELINLFNSIELRYAFDTKTNFHILEVTPESIRRGCDDFVNIEYEINCEFSKLFPNDDILITEPNALTKLVSTEYTTRRNTVVCEIEPIEHSFNVATLWSDLYCPAEYLLAA